MKRKKDKQASKTKSKELLHATISSIYGGPMLPDSAFIWNITKLNVPPTHVKTILYKMMQREVTVHEAEQQLKNLQLMGVSSQIKT